MWEASETDNEKTTPAGSLSLQPMDGPKCSFLFVALTWYHLCRPSPSTSIVHTRSWLIPLVPNPVLSLETTNCSRKLKSCWPSLHALLSILPTRFGCTRLPSSLKLSLRLPPCKQSLTRSLLSVRKFRPVLICSICLWASQDQLLTVLIRWRINWSVCCLLAYRKRSARRPYSHLGRSSTWRWCHWPQRRSLLAFHQSLGQRLYVALNDAFSTPSDLTDTQTTRS